MRTVGQHSIQRGAHFYSRWATASSANFESQPCVSRRNGERPLGFVVGATRSDSDADDATATGAVRTVEGWTRCVLLEAGAIRECDEYGWAKHRADPHARKRAILVARQEPPPGVDPDAVVAALKDVLDSMGNVCPECPPEAH
jgi:hypothetical protein